MNAHVQSVRCGVALTLLMGMSLFSGICVGAFAQDATAPTDPASAVIGGWEFSNADHDKICRFMFRADRVGNGYKLDIDKNCPAVFPVTRDLVAWMVDNFGGLQLLDASGKAVIELAKAEDGIYDGFDPVQGRFVLQSATAAPVPSAEDVIGDWAIVRGTGKPICTLTLAQAAAPGADAMTIKIKPGCDAGVMRFAPTSWRMDQGELIVVSARGQNWRFEEDDANTWQRVPEGTDPMLLVRQQ
jgi:Protease inhibitor Inh